MAVTSKQTSRQRERLSCVQETLSIETTAKNGSSIDLLLGLLCYIEW